jgi:hypothetical protein
MNNKALSSTFDCRCWSVRGVGGATPTLPDSLAGMPGKSIDPQDPETAAYGGQGVRHNSRDITGVCTNRHTLDHII